MDLTRSNDRDVVSADPTCSTNLTVNYVYHLRW